VSKLKIKKGDSFVEFGARSEKIKATYEGIKFIDLSPVSSWKRPKLTRLNLSGNALTNIDLSPLSHCVKLETVDLSSNSLGFSRIDLSPLENCPNLKKVDLSRNELEEIPSLSSTSLEELRLNYNSIQDPDFSVLSSCSNLQILELSNNNIENIDLEPLVGISKLKTLQLSFNQIQSIDFAPLINCINIESLNLSQNVLTEVDLTPLAGHNIQHIDFSRNQISEILLSSLPNFRALSLNSNKLRTIDLGPLGKDSTLTYIGLAENELTEIDLEPLRNHQNLATIYLLDNPIPEIDTNPLEDILYNRELKIFFEGNVVGTSFVELEYYCPRKTVVKIPRIAKSLWLDHLGMTKFDMKQLTRFKGVKRISLQRNSFTELDLSIMEKIPDIEWIRINDNNIETLDLAPLAKCKRLSLLDLSNNKVEDLNLDPISGCESLEILNISGNTLRKDTGLTPLSSCLNLTQVFASNCGSLGGSFDLSIFKNNKKLTHLDISCNNLSVIDFNHLEPDLLLQTLRVASNNLTFINLEGVNRLGELRVLDMAHNPFSTIDLSPLSASRNLSVISLLGVPLSRLDISPLIYLLEHSYMRDVFILSRDMVSKIGPDRGRGWSGGGNGWTLEGEIKDMMFADDVERVILVDQYVPVEMDAIFKPDERSIGQWNSISKTTFDRINWIPARKPLDSFIEEERIQTFSDLLKKLRFMPLDVVYSIMGILEIAPLGANIVDLVKQVDPDSDALDGFRDLYSRAIEFLALEIESGRKTDGFDIEALGRTRAAKIVPLILESRKREIEELTLKVHAQYGRAETYPLYRTYYGKRILENLKIEPGYTLTKSSLTQIRDEFNQMGIKMKIPKGLKNE